jgi:hypothetical protein
MWGVSAHGQNLTGRGSRLQASDAELSESIWTQGAFLHPLLTIGFSIANPIKGAVFAWQLDDDVFASPLAEARVVEID